MKNKRPNVIAKYEKREPPTKKITNKDKRQHTKKSITQITEYTLVSKLYEIFTNQLEKHKNPSF